MSMVKRNRKIRRAGLVQISAGRGARHIGLASSCFPFSHQLLLSLGLFAWRLAWAILSIRLCRFASAFVGIFPVVSVDTYMCTVLFTIHLRASARRKAKCMWAYGSDMVQAWHIADDNARGNDGRKTWTSKKMNKNDWCKQVVGTLNPNFVWIYSKYLLGHLSIMRRTSDGNLQQIYIFRIVLTCGG